jgi:RNA polymerase sigma-70 factor, ECF subfamily
MKAELVQAVELLRRDTPESVERAIGLLQNTVYSFGMKVCGHPEDAEDTMQEVLYRSLPHLRKLREPKALAVWLYTVTRNRCRRMRGAPCTRRNFSLDELLPNEAERNSLLADAAPSPEQTALRAEQSQLLGSAVLRLPVSLRMVLVLHDMEELSTDETAAVLGLKTGTVRVRLHRARLSVQKEMRHRLLQARGPLRPPVQEKPRGMEKTCRKVFANLSEYLDGRLEPAPCEKLRAHMEACPDCLAFLRELRLAIDRCHEFEVPCNPAVTGRLRTMFTEEYFRMVNGSTTGGNLS